MPETALIGAVLVVACANGANDNFKGVATLYGSGTVGYAGALAWATATTFAGALAATLLSGRLVAIFSGKGLVPDSLTHDPRLLAAVAVAAASTLLVATRAGLPVSTTHALLGGLLGAGIAGTGGHVNVAALGTSFVLPLLLSPVVAIAAAWVVYPLLRSARLRLGVEREMCVCADGVPVPVVMTTEGAMFARSVGIPVAVKQRADCSERYLGSVVGFDAQGLLDRVHFLSAGAVSFARGLNDAPKIAALLVAVRVFGIRDGLALVAALMAAGGIFGARRVAETMSRRITTMNHGQAFTANAVTAALVIAASQWGLPVSTTHVSVGALAGIGAATGRARWSTLVRIAAAWLATLPLAAAIGAVAFTLMPS